MSLKIRITRMYPYEGEHTRAFLGVKCQMSGRVFGYNELTLVKKKEGDGLFLGLPRVQASKRGNIMTFFTWTQTQGKKSKKWLSLSTKKPFRERCLHWLRINVNRS